MSSTPNRSDRSSPISSVPFLPYSPPRSSYSEEKDTPSTTTTTSTPFLPTHSSSPSLIQHSRNTSLASLGPTGGSWWNTVSRKIAQRNLGRRAVLGGLLSLVAVVTILSAAAGSTGELEESQGWYIKAREAFHQGFGLTGNAKGDKEEMRELDLLKVSSQSLSLLICAGGPLSWERSRLQVINF